MTTRPIGRAGILLALLAAGCATRAGGPDLEGAQALIEKGREAAERGDDRAAVDLYTKAIRAHPESAEAYYGRGVSHVRLRLDPKAEGDVRPHEQKALDDFSQAIRFNPSFGDAYFNRAMVRFSRAQYKAAADDLRHAAKFKPQDPEPHLLLGRMYEEKFEDMGMLALEHYDQYVDKGGTDPDAREKVRAWRELKKSLAPPPAAAPKGPGPDDEEKAKKLHEEAMKLFRDEKKDEAVKILETLLSTYGQTRYVQSQQGPLRALLNAFKK
jgi:tetratricopeptide (TPR) repeat protein